MKEERIAYCHKNKARIRPFNMKFNNTNVFLDSENESAQQAVQ